MKLQSRSAKRSSGFTLIELLVVMAIIAILVGLIAAAVMKVLGTGPKAVTSSDIAQMDTAVVELKTKLGVKYLPSRFILCESMGHYSTDPQVNPTYAQLMSNNAVLADRSMRFLQLAFDKEVGIAYDPSTGQRSYLHLDWNANGAVDAPVQLEGHQCLVFFLGGVQQRGASGALGVQGFSASNKRNPTDLSGSRLRFFEFKSERLTPGADGYFAYLDGWRKQPYAYFSSYNEKENVYNRGDCASLGIQPYHREERSTTSNNQPVVLYEYHNPTTFQIISAGEDLAYGTGGRFSEGSTQNTISPADRDNLSNITVGRIGN